MNWMCFGKLKLLPAGDGGQISTQLVGGGSVRQLLQACSYEFIYVTLQTHLSRAP